jgi:adenosine deaminase
MATALAKAELHCHLKGSIAPSLARRLAARHGANIDGLVGPDGRYAWKDFAGFLTGYDAVAALVRTPEDYREVVRDYYRRAASQGLVYGEMFVSPAHAAQNGISYATLIDAVSDTMAEVETEFGVTARLIVICVRHWGAQAAEEIARLPEKTPHPYVVGFGMGGDELYGNPRDFSRAFAIARDAGLRLTAHAGEIGGPGSVRDTLRELKVERLGHGVRAMEDPALLTELKDRAIFLEVCPGSNIALGLFPSYEAHPLTRLAAMGVKVGISTDDPGFFADSIGDEYDRVAAAHQLTRDAMLNFTRMSLEAAFCDSATKARLLAGLA